MIQPKLCMNGVLKSLLFSPCVRNPRWSSPEWFPYNNVSSSWQLMLKFKHNDLWQWIKLGIDLRYCIPTCLQTRGPKVQKLIFHYLYMEFIFYLILMVLLNEFLRNNPFRKTLLCNYVKWVNFQLFLLFLCFSLMQKKRGGGQNDHLTGKYKKKWYFISDALLLHQLIYFIDDFFFEFIVKSTFGNSMLTYLLYLLKRGC